MPPLFSYQLYQMSTSILNLARSSASCPQDIIVVSMNHGQQHGQRGFSQPRTTLNGAQKHRASPFSPPLMAHPDDRQTSPDAALFLAMASAL
ncbi:hypothetical protein NEUTE1DRAFT_141403 [Neurospora tetrasperma FGSC 2508]|uniref:Uncharacterized protein n=1 Tax=Neurospora tetrasperma (strain FGSC 2508 / ATCC MYA-4615 / P0657) TaxID=510951 RepID=F8MYQ7_NEUT8|nr:uncharacterized protein NEUTE1DRAFT_141403 [Neurospora tetrasperma FGSC 2508]EGO51454.1 hypothetical protein NEUTE1DRAFT_141403 [Neurospora tetrasperma FGSC 2508]